MFYVILSSVWKYFTFIYFFINYTSIFCYSISFSLSKTGRGKKKKLKQLLPIFALLQLKIQSLIPLFLGIIAFAAIKGLLLAKAALLASALVLLKKLLSKHEHHESYEVVAHPHHDEHYSHGGGHGGGWGRSQDAQNLAYSAYAD